MQPDNNLQNLRKKSLVDGDKYEMDSWVLHLPPINLYNVDLIYLAFGYDVRYELRASLDATLRKSKYDNETFRF